MMRIIGVRLELRNLIYRFTIKSKLLKGNVVFFKEKGLIFINLRPEGHRGNMGSMSNLRMNCMNCKNPIHV
jgi:hypothetical protein